MKEALAKEVARRIVVLTLSSGLADPPNPPLSSSRDFAEEDRIAELKKDLEKAQPAFKVYIGALLLGESSDEVLEAADILDDFWANHIAPRDWRCFKTALLKA